MNLKIDAKNTTVTEAIRSYIETKFEPLNFRQNRESLKEQFDKSNIELTESEE